VFSSCVHPLNGFFYHDAFLNRQYYDRHQPLNEGMVLHLNNFCYLSAKNTVLSQLISVIVFKKHTNDNLHAKLVAFQPKLMFIRLSKYKA